MPTKPGSSVVAPDHSLSPNIVNEKPRVLRRSADGRRSGQQSRLAPAITTSINRGPEKLDRSDKALNMGSPPFTFFDWSRVASKTFLLGIILRAPEDLCCVRIYEQAILSIHQAGNSGFDAMLASVYYAQLEIVKNGKVTMRVSLWMEVFGGKGESTATAQELYIIQGNRYPVDLERWKLTGAGTSVRIVGSAWR